MDKYPSDIFFQYLEGNCSVGEAKSLLEWLGTDEGKVFFENEMEEADWIFFLSLISREKDPHLSDIKKQKLFEKITNHPGFEKKIYDEKTKKRISISYYNPWIKIAASLIIFLVTALAVFQYQFRYKHYQTDYGETKHFNLADGSELTLNGNSSVKFDKYWRFTGIRNALLTGEAFFNVKTLDEKIPFQVHTSEKLHLEVLGTKFNVTSRKNKTQIVLNSGKIRVHIKENKKEKQSTNTSKIMNPGDYIAFDEETNDFELKQVKPEQYSAWKNHKLILNDTKLRDLVIILEETYGIDILVLDNELLEESFTGSIPSYNITTILQSISQLADFELTIENEQKVIFTKNN